VPVGVAVAPPVAAVDQVAKVILAPPLELDFHLPVVLAVVAERQAFPVPIVRVADQVDLIGPDRTGDLEGDDDSVFINSRSFVDHVSSRDADSP